MKTICISGERRGNAGGASVTGVGADKVAAVAGVAGSAASISSNTYIYYDEQTLAGVVIDPGVGARKVIEAIESNSIVIKHILLTHGHYDHVAAVPEIKNRYKADVCSLKEENEILQNPIFNVSILMGRYIKIVADKFLCDGEEINVGAGTLRVIHTPGHTVGGACYYDARNRVVFVGDTLFNESIGRTDFFTGDFNSIISSIKLKLFLLPDDVMVYCGHGERTTIGHEKTRNPFLTDMG